MWSRSLSGSLTSSCADFGFVGKVVPLQSARLSSQSSTAVVFLWGLNVHHFLHFAVL